MQLQSQNPTVRQIYDVPYYAQNCQLYNEIYFPKLNNFRQDFNINFHLSFHFNVPFKNSTNSAKKYIYDEYHVNDINNINMSEVETILNALDIFSYFNLIFFISVFLFIFCFIF